VAVRYDVDSNAELGIVRVDGGLSFATTTDTKMVLDTLITDTGSILTIGTKEDPVRANVSAEIVIADNGPIDLAADPTQIGRGVITHGKTEFHGAEKEAYLKLAEEPLKGDTELLLEGDLSGWQVGDELVVMGTKYLGNDSDGILKTQDEEVVITAIDRATGTVTIDRPLAYDHTTPDYVGRDGIDNELNVYVGNSSRNVTISSENPEGVRGHVMFMHSDEVDVRYAE
ncbi:MAG: G8 domain-containing protein, partial [Pseudomonadota bacterium]